jgi:hypothetical protein
VERPLLGVVDVRLVRDGGFALGDHRQTPVSFLGWCAHDVPPWVGVIAGKDTPATGRRYARLAEIYIGAYVPTPPLPVPAAQSTLPDPPVRPLML